MLVKSPLYGDVSEKSIMGITYPFSVGTLTFVQTIETFVEKLATVPEQFAVADRFFSFGEDD
jgi:hypothetical protein